MKFLNILPLAALSAAIVIPDEQVMSQVAIESHRAPESAFEKLPTKKQAITQFENTFSKLIDTSKDAFDEVIDHVTEAGENVYSKAHETGFAVQEWLDSASDSVDDLGKHGKHGKHGHHGHCKKPNLTVYELIAKSKYTTKLAALINEYDDLVELLNGTAANYT
jgi:putative heme iron utilization protein